MNPNAILAELFRSHGVMSEAQGEWVVFAEHGMRAQARAFEHSGPAIQLDVCLEVWPGWLLVESFAGIGNGKDACVEDAFANFALGSLHVLLSAFFRRVADDQVTREQWVINGLSRTITLGNVTQRGNCGRPAWFPQFEAALKATALPEGTHWIRLYYAQQDGQAMTHEVLLDNEAWPDMQRLIERFAWPTDDGFQSARLFLVIQGGVDVPQACGVISRSQNAVEDLVAVGATPREATLLYALITLAFGRTLLEPLGITLSDRFVVQSSNGKVDERALADEPIFITARAVAQARTHLSKEQFVAIALQSSELNAVNQALNAGSKPEDLMAAPPVVRMP